MSPSVRLQSSSQLLESVAQALRVLSLPSGSDCLWHVAQAVRSIEEAREHIAAAKGATTLG